MGKEYHCVFVGLILFGYISHTNGILCPYCGKDYAVFGRHAWRCSQRGTSSNYVTPGQPPSLTPTGASPVTAPPVGISVPHMCTSPTRPTKRKRRATMRVPHPITPPRPIGFTGFLSDSTITSTDVACDTLNTDPPPPVSLTHVASPPTVPRLQTSTLNTTTKTTVQPTSPHVSSLASPRLALRATSVAPIVPRRLRGRPVMARPSDAPLEPRPTSVGHDIRVCHCERRCQGHRGLVSHQRFCKTIEALCDLDPSVSREAYMCLMTRRG